MISSPEAAGTRPWQPSPPVPPDQIHAAQSTCDCLLASDHVSIWGSLEAFRESVTKLEGSLNILHALAELQAGKTSGFSVDKDRLRRSLRKRLITVGDACIAFGRARNDSELVTQACALDSKTELEEIGDILIDDYAQMLCQHALEARDAAPAVAASYGFKKDAGDPILAPLLAAILAYGTIVARPRSCTIRRAGIPAGIQSELQRLQAILQDELDPFIEEFEPEHTDFVRAYFETRKIAHPEGRHLEEAALLSLLRIGCE